MLFAGCVALLTALLYQDRTVLQAVWSLQSKLPLLLCSTELRILLETI